MTIDLIRRHQQLQSIKPEEHETPYQKLYRLRENPFPALALFTPAVDDPRRNGEIYDETFRIEEEKRFFDLFVQSPTGDEALKLGFVRLDLRAGGRGSGKSIFMNRLMNRVNTQQWDSWPKMPNSPGLFALAVHVLPEPRQQKRFWQFIRLIFETMADRGLYKKVDAELRAATLLRLLSEEQIASLTQRSPEQVTSALQSGEAFRNLLKEFGRTTPAYQEQVEQQLRTVTSGDLDNKFLHDFLEAGAEMEGLWSSWKTALSDYRWRNLGINWFLGGVIPVLMVAGYQRFYVLLDEFEKIYVYQSAREREEFLGALRQYFYERDSVAVRRQYITTVLTTHPSIDRYLQGPWVSAGLEGLVSLNPARMQHQAVELGKSTPDKLAHLLVTYLDYFRMDDMHGTLYPFEIDALEPAMNAARFYPRDTLWYAYALLQKAASEEIAPPITRRFVEEFVASGPRPPVGPEDSLFELPLSESNLQA